MSEVGLLSNHKLPRLGLMQGRLLPPQEGRYQCFPLDWNVEIDSALSLGIDFIEWIVEEPNLEQNPLSPRSNSAASTLTRSISIDAICADYFMTQLIVDVDGRWTQSSFDMLKGVIAKGNEVSASVITLPFVDSSSLDSAKRREGLVNFLRAFCDSTDIGPIKIGLETDFSPQIYSQTLRELEDYPIGVTWDTGNSASLGFDPEEEFAAFGDRIYHVHIKDRILGGGTVPLGEGDAKLPLIFTLLKQINYESTLCLQAARQEPGNEVETVRQYMVWLNENWGD